MPRYTILQESDRLAYRQVDIVKEHEALLQPCLQFDISTKELRIQFYRNAGAWPRVLLTGQVVNFFFDPHVDAVELGVRINSGKMDELFDAIVEGTVVQENGHVHQTPKGYKACDDVLGVLDSLIVYDAPSN